MKPLWSILPLCALTLLFGLPGHAQNAPAPAIAPPAIDGPPDVVVVVYQQPGAADQVNITYDPAVPHAQALADCRALTQAGKWPSSPLQVKEAAPPVKSQSGPMTSVTFQALGVVQDTTHTFPVDTFARAFHSYHRMNLVFLVGPQFQFQGVHSYADPNIRMSLDQRSTSYVYQIEVLHPNFGVLPMMQVQTSLQAGAGNKSPVFGLVDIFIVALLAGIFVYGIAAWRLTKRAAQELRLEDKANSKTESQKEAAGKR